MSAGAGACACGSGREYAECCGPCIAGTREPETAEALMRARYTAHTRGEMDYLVHTHAEEGRADIDVQSTRRWAARCEWLGLEILATSDGRPGDARGTVEFVAHYRERDQRQRHHERALFERREQRWLYVDAEAPQVETARRTQPKVGRNDPCPCGSGRKYKKCCGRASA